MLTGSQSEESQNHCSSRSGAVQSRHSDQTHHVAFLHLEDSLHTHTHSADWHGAAVHGCSVWGDAVDGRVTL